MFMSGFVSSKLRILLTCASYFISETENKYQFEIRWNGVFVDCEFYIKILFV